MLGLILTLPPACGIPIRLSLRVLLQSSWAGRSIVAQVAQMPGCLISDQRLDAALGLSGIPGCTAEPGAQKELI